MPSVANLAIYQGDDYVATVLVSDDQGNAEDLTGYTAQAQMRLGPAQTNPQVAWQIEAEVQAPNIVTLTIPHDATAQMSGDYVWDLQLTSPDGEIDTILAGSVTVTPEVTLG